MVESIEKEAIEGLQFPKEEVVLNPEDRVVLRKQLDRASTLGNLEKHKVKVVFEDAVGIKEVHTTVWAVTDRMIMLKAGRGIPLHRVHSIALL